MYKCKVAPFAGAWIEIKWIPNPHILQPVAPFAGAWIEIVYRLRIMVDIVSLPSRERGLKSPVPVPQSSTLWSLPSRERGLK